MAKVKKVQAEPEDADDSQSRMTFGEHLEELRKRIIYALLGSIFGVVLCLYYSKEIINWIVRPYLLAMAVNDVNQVFSFTKPAEVVIMYLTTGIQAGLIVSSPWIIYQLWAFVAAGLYPRERKTVYRYIGPSAFLFLLGVAFFYFLVLPMTLSFFIRFTSDTAMEPPKPTWFEKALHLDPAPPQVEPAPAAPATTTTTTNATTNATVPATAPMVKIGALVVPSLDADPDPPPSGVVFLYYHALEHRIKMRTHNETITLLYVKQGSLFTNFPSLDDYLSFVAWTSLIFGLAFELPMVMLILGQVGIVAPQTFRNVRKYAYFGLAVLSAFAAPTPDPTTMLFLMIPLIGLYELGIVAASISVRRQEKRATEE